MNIISSRKLLISKNEIHSICFFCSVSFWIEFEFTESLFLCIFEKKNKFILMVNDVWQLVLSTTPKKEIWLPNLNSDSCTFYIFYIFCRDSDSQMGVGCAHFWRNNSQNGGLGVGPPIFESRFSKPLIIIIIIIIIYYIILELII